jgi:indolepyruvate ferredoxin oxidoreductase, beta subunit
MKIERPVCVLMAALGGQGGGVLVDWLVQAARIDGLKAQATSIPGVAQRTGATTYYFEVYPQHDFPARPVFSIFPASGAIDLMVSFEPMETARALSSGYISQDTTVITARERIYSTFEKIKPGDGITPLAPVFDALNAIAGSLTIIEMAKAARNAGCHPNAVMFGAMVASEIMPMKLKSCREAISQSGVAVKSNLAGFDAGMALRFEPADSNEVPPVEFDVVPAAFASTVAALPEAVQPLAGHAAAQLLDYQDASYVELYLDRLRKIVASDNKEQGYRLSLEVARRLAAWMIFEDVVRVAQLKTRPGRLKRIRNELGISEEAPLSVHDYLKPGREELRGILPSALGKWMPAIKTGQNRPGIALKINTSGPFGWAMMCLLSSLKSIRPRSARFEQEQAMINQWLLAVTTVASEDYQLACKLAELAVWARGYGDTRNRGFDQLTKLLEDSQHKIKIDIRAFAEAVSTSLESAYSDQER